MEVSRSRVLMHDTEVDNRCGCPRGTNLSGNLQWTTGSKIQKCVSNLYLCVVLTGFACFCEWSSGKGRGSLSV